jgi:hypothetical protein
MLFKAVVVNIDDESVCFTPARNAWSAFRVLSFQKLPLTGEPGAATGSSCKTSGISVATSKRQVLEPKRMLSCWPAEGCGTRPVEPATTGLAPVKTEAEAIVTQLGTLLVIARNFCDGVAFAASVESTFVAEA